MGKHDGVVVREATETDFEEWLRLYEAVAGEGKWIGGEAPVDRLGRRRAFDATLANPEAAALVADVRGGMVGSLGVEIHSGIAEFGMVVDKDWRGRGVGSALLQACISWARDQGAHKVVLEVWPHNLGAQALYRKHGFEDEGRFRRQYRRRNGELWDAIRMGLVLDLESPGSPYGSG